MNWQFHILIITMIVHVQARNPWCTHKLTYDKAGDSAIGITVGESDHADCGCTVMGRIGYRGDDDSTIFSVWRDLDNKDCNDFEKGETNWFAFDGPEKDKEWTTLHLVNCDDDGVQIDALSFKQNGETYETVDYFVNGGNTVDHLWMQWDEDFERGYYFYLNEITNYGSAKKVKYLSVKFGDCPAEGSTAPQYLGHLESGFMQFLVFDATVSVVSSLFVIALCLSAYYCMKKGEKGGGRVSWQKVNESEETGVEDQEMQ